MKTQEIVEITGLSKDTLRYYETMGLVHPDRSGYARNYRVEDVERINHILQLKELDFTLQEIQLLVSFDDIYTSQEAIDNMNEGDQKLLNDLITGKLTHLEQKLINIQKGIGMLTYMRNKIENLSK